MDPKDKQISIIDNYNLYFYFIDQYLPGGFKVVNKTDPLILKLEEMTEANNQFFCIFDLIQLKILFTSRRSIDMIGIAAMDINPSVFNKSMHPDDLVWHNIAQTKLFNVGQDIFMKNNGNALVSTNFRLKNSSGEFINTMVQYYLFFTDAPYKTVFILQVLTDISWFDKKKPGYHFYLGNDPYYFRYPDENLLLKGNVFSTM
jgi:hypothetical protein